ncbi:hypothetical protein C0J52_02995 [Blattella germanica]|nr:hypothetical protein C0J52_02995 [Blattella germanica]
MKVLAILRRTSGAILGTRSEYSPRSHRIDALAWGTVMKSTNLAICIMMSLCSLGCVCNSFLITTTLSATTASATSHSYSYPRTIT